MRRIDRSIITALCFVFLAFVPVSGSAEDTSGLKDCGDRKCTEWAPKGEKTCRTCSTVQCEKQGDQELMKGVKKETQCYEGHGDPPSDEEAGE